MKKTIVLINRILTSTCVCVDKDIKDVKIAYKANLTKY